MNASFINYLLNLFDGKISITEIQNLPMSLLVQLRKIKEKELEGKANEMKRIKESGSTQTKTISNTGKRFIDKAVAGKF